MLLDFELVMFVLVFMGLLFGLIWFLCWGCFGLGLSADWFGVFASDCRWAKLFGLINWCFV